MQKKNAIKLIYVSCFILFFPTLLYASSAQLFHQSAVNTGDYGASSAAIANDASTAFYNPAGLIRIPNQQLVVSGNWLHENIQLSGASTNSSILNPHLITIENNEDVQGGNTHFIPALHYAAPLTECLVLGFSLTQPFLLDTHYPESSIFRYFGSKTNLTTWDVSPSLGFKLNPKFAIGAGFDAVRANLDVNSWIGIPGDVSFDTLSKNSATTWGYGWHAGLLYQPTDCTRIGFAYHSQITLNFHGRSRLLGKIAALAATGSPLSGSLISNQFCSTVQLPPWFELSYFHQINPCWAIDASASYIQWKKLNGFVLKNIQNVTVNPISGNISPSLSNNCFGDFNDTVRFAAGGIYRPIPCLWFRAGLGFETAATGNEGSDPRLPEARSFGFALGGHYQIVKTFGIDVGWTHTFIANQSIHKTEVHPLQQVSFNGRLKSQTDIVGAQLTWDFIGGC